MSDNLNISGTSDYSHSVGSNQGEHHSGKSFGSEAVPLHPGEIVRGSILERIDKDTALVQLPMGSYRAMVNENLEKGDTLYFKVQIASPTLILKINEIQISNDKKYSTDNLIRLLDLPDDFFYRTLLDLIKEYKNTVNKDYILELLNGYNQLNDTQKKSRSTGVLLRVLIEMKEAGFPLKSNLIEKILPLFNTEDQIKDALVGLFQLKQEIPFPYNDKLKQNLFFLESNSTENIPLIKLAEIFSLNTENESSFFNTILSITKNEDKNSLVLVKARAYAKLLLSTIEAMSLWNAFANENNAGSHLFLPLLFNGNLTLARLIVAKNNDHTVQEEKLVSFSISTPTDNIGIIDTHVNAMGNIVNISMQTNDNTIVDLLQAYKNDLEKMINSQSYILKSIKFGVISKTNPQNKPPGTGHLTVVV